MRCWTQNKDLKPRRRSHGSALLELTTALFVLTVGVMGSLTAYDFHRDRVRTLQEYTLVHAALTSELENLKAQPPGAIAPGEGQAFLTAPPALTHLHLAEAWTDMHASPLDAGLIEVVVHLRWVGEHGRIIERTLATLLPAGH